MSHLTEEQLILHYYGEEGDTLSAEQHLEQCEECRALYGSLQRVLNIVDSLPVPSRGPEYGAAVWNRIEGKLPRRRFVWQWAAPWRWAAASAAMASLLVVAFLAGRFYPHGVIRPQDRKPLITASDSQNGERVLLLAVGDYLERSQMVLVELANANPKGPLDISEEQARAADLVSESRLYRQTADHNGDDTVSSVLEELDRVLLDISHAPSQISPEDLENLRQRLEAEGIIFKIRVLGSNVRNPKNQLEAPASARQKL
jgi:hypothetical protein